MLPISGVRQPTFGAHEFAPSARTARTSSARPYYLDHLRVALTMLVIVHHLALTYGALGHWYYQEPSDDPLATVVLTVLVLVNQAFFMGGFFLLAGFFTPGSFDRKGGRAFLGDRLRLGIPLLVYEFVLGPLATLPIYQAVTDAAVSAGSTPPSSWDLYVSHLDPGPLWFVEVLLIFSAVYALVRWCRRHRQSGRSARCRTPGLPAMAAFVVLLAGASFVWRLVAPMGLYVPVLGLPTLSHLPQYAGLFAIGILASRQDWLAALPEAAAWRGFAVAALSLLLLLLPIALIGLPDFTGGPHSQAAAYALWEAVFVVGMIIGLLVTMRRRFGRQERVGQLLSQQAYTAYIIHAPVIVGLAVAMRAVVVYPLLKLVLATARAIPICFAAAYLLRKLPGARSVL